LIPVDIDALIDHLEDNGPMLASAAEQAGLDAAVPGTEWDVRSLVTHIGGIHRWAADVVATRGSSLDTAAGQAVGTGPRDAELLDWFADGHAALVETLRSAPHDLECITFLPADSALHFWARRQSHETAVHRADAQAAAGPVVPFVEDFAQDGIAEVLLGFAARKPRSADSAMTIGLAAEDGMSWRIALGDHPVAAEPTDDVTGADAIVRGRSSELYLWLWNRPSAARVNGDPAVAACWAQTVRIRWS
jgi:uncharacterized protein (TIGR03083 family)